MFAFRMLIEPNSRRSMICFAPRKRMVAIGIGCILGLVLLAPRFSQAIDDRIVAVVNDEVISSRDVENRIALFLVTGNLQDSPEIRRRLEPEVINMLIDDSLKRQEARRLDIVVGREDIDRALSQVAQQIKVPPEQLSAVLAQRGVNLATLREQIETEIGWSATVRRLARDAAQVSEEDIDEELEQHQVNAGKPELRIGEIFLPIDSPQDEENVRALAVQLIDALRNGASFAGLARIFSQGPAALEGGDLGWIRPGQLDPQLEQVVFRMQPGQLAGPVRGPSGVHILALIGRRTAGMPGATLTVDLQQVFAPLPPSASPSQIQEMAETLSSLGKSAATCPDLATLSAEQDGVSSRHLGLDPQRLPPELRQIVATLDPGDVTQPIRSSDGLAIFMLCERNEAAADDKTREDIRRFLRDERLAAASRRHLRDLRRNAMVDTSL